MIQDCAQASSLQCQLCFFCEDELWLRTWKTWDLGQDGAREERDGCELVHAGFDRVDLQGVGERCVSAVGGVLDCYRACQGAPGDCRQCIGELGEIVVACTKSARSARQGGGATTVSYILVADTSP